MCIILLMTVLTVSCGISTSSGNRKKSTDSTKVKSFESEPFIYIIKDGSYYDTFTDHDNILTQLLSHKADSVTIIKRDRFQENETSYGRWVIATHDDMIWDKAKENVEIGNGYTTIYTRKLPLSAFKLKIE